MSDEFEFSADFDFGDELEDFDSELEDIGDFDEDADDFLVRTAVLQKNDMVALLCIKSASEGAAICRVDPRESKPAVQIYDDPEKALEWFTKSLKTSRRNGWQVIYDGLPLQG
jgi:hypothetical protein